MTIRRLRGISQIPNQESNTFGRWCQFVDSYCPNPSPNLRNLRNLWIQLSLDHAVAEFA